MVVSSYSTRKLGCNYNYPPPPVSWFMIKVPEIGLLASY